MKKERVFSPCLEYGVNKMSRMLVVLMLGMLAWAGAQTPPAFAQLSDDGEVASEGTQFIPKPSPVEPPPAEKAPPEKAPPKAPVAENPPLPPAKPPRYPSVVILLDTSDSMLNTVHGPGRTRLHEAREALIKVLEGMAPETRVQLWTFNTRMQPVPVNNYQPGDFVPVGDADNRRALVEQVYRIKTAGGTNLYQSVVKALKLFDRPEDQAAYRSGERWPALVVVSDGEDGGKTKADLKAVQQAKQAYPHVTVSTIGFRISRGEPWFGILCKIASRKDGCSTANDGTQLELLLESFYQPPP